MEKRDTKKSSFDVAIVGGGPAGIMSALIASESGQKVVLIEKNRQLGKKFVLTGNGRSNITNAEFNLKKLVGNYNKGAEFLFHAFSIFGPKETISFFEKLGIKTKIENNNRVFPISNDAKKVLEILTNKLLEKNVNIIFGTSVSDIILKGKKISKLIVDGSENYSDILAKNFIICTGGKSYSPTGSDGFGYKLVEKLGHSIVKLMPALSPIKVKESWTKDIQGISLNSVRISIFFDDKKQVSEDGEIMFTHFGITGPAIFNISTKVGELLEKGKVKISLDLFPLLNQEEVLKELEDILVRYPNRTVKNVLSFFVPERLAEVLSTIAVVKKDKIANNMSKIEKGLIAKVLKNFYFTADEIFDFNQAMVTRGGVNLKEIDHKTMKSKI
ncbi:MAG: aminoacetone oxidase family FAD-binding enzyme, partial [Candidatus Staskawiczbacteria bacterium]